MHNIDRTTGEMGYEFSNEFSQESYELSPELTGELGQEYSNEYSGELGHEYSNEFSQEHEHGSQEMQEMMEMELASELLAVGNEAELEQFLGKLIRRAAGAVKTFAQSSAGRAIGGILKAAAKKALPIAAGALGTAFGGPAGGMIGSKLGSMASNLFELELEGLSNEDKEFELARAYVRFANNAVRRAARNPRYRQQPRQIAKGAVIAAARQYAPGFLRRRSSVKQQAAYNDNGWNSGAGTNYGNPNSPAASGTWYRDGNQIILNL